ncbi:probable transcription factor GLK1 isoform X4 [Musa acuminata AAA Group]
MTQGTPCFPQPLPAARFPAPPPVPGIVPQPMYRPIPPPVTDHSSSQLQLDAHPVDRESLVSCVQEGFTSCLPHGLFVSRMVWNSNVAV